MEALKRVEGGEVPLGDASVDAVVSFETLEHVREHARFMAEVKRVLRPGGKLIISTPERVVYSARGEPVNKYHLLELSVAEFYSLLRANFYTCNYIESASYSWLFSCKDRRRRLMAKLRTAITGVFGGEQRVGARAFPDRHCKRPGDFACPLIGLPGSTAARRGSRSVLAIAGLPIAGSRARCGDRPPERRCGGTDAEIGRLNVEAAARDAGINRLIDKAAARYAEIDRLTTCLRVTWRLYDELCSGDFAPGRGGLLQLLGMSLPPCCRFHPAEVKEPHRSAGVCEDRARCSSRLAERRANAPQWTIECLRRETEFVAGSLR